LLNNDRVDEVHSIVRRRSGVTNQKLTEHEIDFDHLSTKAPEFSFDAVFCCLGTTIKKAGSREEFRKVDYEYVKQLAEKYSSSSQFLVVSAMGADANSRVFYNQVKGEMEEAVKKSGIPSVQIFRPSLLLGDRKEFRFGEMVGSIFMRIFSPLMIGGMRKYRPIKASVVASGMLSAAFFNPKSPATYDSQEIKELASRS
jgi:uncharacterized protein YbjT (DUF2867 family)